jgi:hypothetical protein
MTTPSTPSDVPDVLAPGLEVVLRSIPLYPSDLPSELAAMRGPSRAAAGQVPGRGKPAAPEYGQCYDSMYTLRG